MKKKDLRPPGWSRTFGESRVRRKGLRRGHKIVYCRGNDGYYLGTLYDSKGRARDLEGWSVAEMVHDARTRVLGLRR